MEDFVLKACKLRAIGQYDQALAVLRDGSEKGDAASMVWLGRCHRDGFWITAEERDDTIATKYFRQAAEQGNGEGMTLYAKQLLSGAGVESDKDEALAWGLRCLELGDECCYGGSTFFVCFFFLMSFVVGKCHYWGIGTKQSYQKAFEWYVLFPSLCTFIKRKGTQRK